MPRPLAAPRTYAGQRVGGRYENEKDLWHNPLPVRD
jgi:hypothetical protein